MSRESLKVLWAFAALVGLTFGAMGSSPVAEPAPEPSAETVAFVGEIPILKAELDAALRDADLDPAAASPETRRQVLESLIEDELWLQAALKNGRLHDHRRVREAVTRRMMDVIFPADETPSDRDLQALYDETYPDGLGPELFQVRFRLTKQWRLRRNEEALQDYLSWLRQLTKVQVVADDAALLALLEEGGTS